MDRLLNENEITKIVGWPSAFEYAKIVELNKAQISKTDKEWVEWLENVAQQFNHKDGDYMEIEDSAWQERKLTLRSTN